MSTLKVNTIQDTTGNDALTIDSSGNVTASQGFVPSTQLSHRNLIINGDFQVSQRGDYTSATSATNLTYYLDRWFIAQAVACTIQDTTDSVKLVATASGTSLIQIRQWIESINIRPLIGQEIIISAKVTSNSSNARIVVACNGYLTLTGNDVHSGGGTEETLTAKFTMPSDASSNNMLVGVGIDGELSADVSISTGDYAEIRDVQLEVGSVATPFEHRSYGEELARCRRYFIKKRIGGIGLTPTGQANIIWNYSYPNGLRTSPSLSYTSTQGTANYLTRGLTAGEFAYTQSGYYSHSEMLELMYYLGSNSNVVQGEAYEAIFSIDAEL